MKSRKQDIGELELDLRFAGVVFREGDWLYADLDGLVTAERELSL